MCLTPGNIGGDHKSDLSDSSIPQGKATLECAASHQPDVRSFRISSTMTAEIRFLVRESEEPPRIRTGFQKKKKKKLRRLRKEAYLALLVDDQGSEANLAS